MEQRASQEIILIQNQYPNLLNKEATAGLVWLFGLFLKLHIKPMEAKNITREGIQKGSVTCTVTCELLLSLKF